MTKEDLRVYKNKRAIQDSFLSLLQEKSFAAITVSEICSKAEVNRSTFYFHYCDKNDLLEEIYLDALTEYTHMINKAFLARGEEFANDVKKAFFYVTRHRTSFTVIMNLDEAKRPDEKRIHSIYVQEFTQYAEEAGVRFKKQDYVYLYANLFASCAEEMLRWWLNGAMKEERYQEAADIIQGCLQKGMNKAFLMDA